MNGPHPGVAASYILLALFACMLTARVQAQARRSYSVAMVLPRPPGEIEQAFEEYFAKRGIALRITTLAYSGHSAEQPALLTQLRELKPDLIYIWGTRTTLAVAGPANGDPQQYIRDIPVVFTSVSDPLAAGLVDNLKRPGRNLTGVNPLAPLPVQINAISAYRRFHTLGFLYEGDGRDKLAFRDHLHTLAAAQGIKLLDERIPPDANGDPDASAIPVLVQQLKARGADFLYIAPETSVDAGIQDEMARAALDTGLPTFSARESVVRRSGALFGLFSPQVNIGRLAALKAMRILTQHVSPTDEPIEALQHFSLLINMHTALRLEAYPPLLLLDVAEVVTGDDSADAPHAVSMRSGAKF